MTNSSAGNAYTDTQIIPTRQNRAAYLWTLLFATIAGTVGSGLWSLAATGDANLGNLALGLFGGVVRSGAETLAIALGALALLRLAPAFRRLAQPLQALLATVAGAVVSATITAVLLALVDAAFRDFQF